VWLDDERARDFLIDLLDEQDRKHRLEFGRPMGIPAKEMPHQPSDYDKLRKDPAFRAHLVAAIRKRNAESKNGR
jgi:hypothetical protein